jgi:hypothetical protein
MKDRYELIYQMQKRRMNMKDRFAFIYQATVSWYEDGESRRYRIAGLGFCSDFADAVHQIESKEGRDLESIEHLELLGEKNDTIIEIPPSIVKTIIDYDIYNLTPYTKEYVSYD